MLIIFIGIQLNMAAQKTPAIGLIPAFIVMLNKAFIPRIGEIMRTPILRGLNDVFDAPPYVGAPYLAVLSTNPITY